MAFNTFKEKLKDTTSPEHTALLAHVRGLIDKSRSEMSKNYSRWDEHDAVFRSRRAVDKEDANALAKGQPKKLIVPLTFSQIMTFAAFAIMSITQNVRFFELEPTGTEDNPLTEPLELILERDLRRNTWNTFLLKFFMDIGRFHLGAAEVCYEEQVEYMRVEREETTQGAFGATQTNKTYNMEPIPTFQGNKVYSLSPYHFFPDTSLPLSRYQEGEFCGSEDIFQLSALESQKGLFNLDKIPKFSAETYKERLKVSRIGDLGVCDDKLNPNLLGFGTDSGKDGKTMVRSGPVATSKCVFKLNPKRFSDRNPQCESLGEEDFTVRYICWYGNDGTIVRFEEAYYLHCQFPYISGQYIPDTNQSLADICEEITNLITWKINAHVASTRNSVQSRYVVDPAGVDTKNLDSTNPFIYLKKNAALTDVRRYITQFKTEDVTQNVMSDVNLLKDLNEGITGNSAQMQGQYSQGRRSATQDRVVAQGAGARGKVLLGSIWDSAFEKLGKQLISNNRQEMDFETFAAIVGDREWPVNPATRPTPEVIQQYAAQGQPPPPPVPFTTEEIFALFKADPVAIAKSEDFFVFDGTLPSEKAFLAQSLQEILMSLLQTPEVMQLLGYGPDEMRELFKQVYVLRGVTPARLPKGSPQPPLPPEGDTNAPKPPSESISIKLADLSGDERVQALALFGIKADNPAHEKRLKLENSPARNGTA